MEASFKNRVEQAFGALLGSPLQRVSAPRVAVIASSSPADAATNSWSVREVAIPCQQGSRGLDESSGSDSDEPCAARYEKFVQLARRPPKVLAGDDDEGLEEEIDLDKGREAKRRRSEESVDPVSAATVQQDLDEDEECREMRLMVGMDDTLDFEEEEDEYDKVAVGREGAGERVYMREIKGDGPGIAPLTPLPVPATGIERRQFGRDSRANHTAAAARLQEDDRLATIKNADIARILSLSKSSGSAKHTEFSGDKVEVNVRPHPVASSCLRSNVKPALKGILTIAKNGNAEAESSSKLTTVTDEDNYSNGATHQSAMEVESFKDGGGKVRDSGNLLGQRESAVRKVENLKKVRFAVAEDEEELKSARDIQEVLPIPARRNRYGLVPDHVRNPSKYTHYTLEWSDEEEDDKTNLTAFQETWAVTHEAEKQEMKGIVELPKSITFTPRSGGALSKSNGEAKLSTGSGFQQSQALVSFAEEVIVDNSPHPEEASLSTSSLKASVEAKTVRVFRKRAREEENDDSNAEDNAL